MAVSDTSRRSMRKAGGGGGGVRSPYGRLGGGRRTSRATGGDEALWWAGSTGEGLPEDWALQVPSDRRAGSADGQGADEGGHSTVLSRQGPFSVSATDQGTDTVWRMRGVVHAMLQAWNSAQ